MLPRFVCSLILSISNEESSVCVMVCTCVGFRGVGVRARLSCVLCRHPHGTTRDRNDTISSTVMWPVVADYTYSASVCTGVLPLCLALSSNNFEHT